MRFMMDHVANTVRSVSLRLDVIKGEKETNYVSNNLSKKPDGYGTCSNYSQMSEVQRAISRWG